MMPRRVAALGALLVPVVAIAMLLAPIPVPALPSADTSFETGMEGWEARGIVASWGNCTGSGGGNCTSSWSVERTTDAAHEGSVSLRMSLDGGWVWIERAFDVGSGATVHASLDFVFATERNVTFDHRDLIVAILPWHPTSGTDLPSSTDSGITDGGAQGGVAWHETFQRFTLDPTAGGQVWVVLGFSASAAGPRTYYVDAVRVSFRPA